jgi:3-dehydroquinate synthetase
MLQPYSLVASYKNKNKYKETTNKQTNKQNKDKEQFGPEGKKTKRINAINLIFSKIVKDKIKRKYVLLRLYLVGNKNS